MSKTIDQKVVEMQFDNRQFEKGVSTTMSSVEKLKRSLSFNGASKGLEEVGSAVKKIDMNGLASSVETVKARFSALQVMGVTALANITNSAVNAGKRIVSALTIDPIMTGFQEYETQINAVQTILANTQSKGTTLTDVNAALDELNKYADQTIYNFTEMTRNIGTFTAAGVDLDKSVTSIKGIANLAAVSGSNAQQASTAMYQLSQALAAGRVSLMDWNSVVNAGMGGEVFQTALKRTAENFGFNVDGMIKKYGSFRESLTEGGWLTAEVLTETLTQLSGAYTEADLVAQGYTRDQAKAIVDLANTAVSAATDVKTFTQLWDTLKEAAQSGWTQTWEILVGDFEEAKGLLGELYQTFGDIINQSSEARNNLLYDAMTSNWKKITDGITDAGLSAEDFKNKITEVAKSKGMNIDDVISDYGSLESAFKNGALSSDLLNEALLKMTGSSEQISKKLSDLRGKYKTNEDVIKALNKAGYENADIQDLITKSTNGQIISLNDLSDAQLMSIGYTADQVKSIRDLSSYAELAGGSLKSLIDNVAVPQGRELLIDSLRVSLRNLIAIFGRVGAAWREVFPPMSSEELLNIIKSVQEFTLSLRPSEETLDKLQRTFRGLFSVLSIGKQAISAFLSPIKTLIENFSGLGGGILDVTASLGDWLYALDQSIKIGDPFSVISDGISGFINTVSNAIGYLIDGLGGSEDAISNVGSIVSKVFNSIKNTVGEVFGWIRENISPSDIFAGLAGGGIFVLAKKFSGFINTIKEAFEGLFDGLGDKGGGFSDVLGSIHDSLESFQQGIKVASLVGIATAVTLLTSSLKKISEIEPVKIAYSLLAIRLMIASLTSGFNSLSKTLSKFNAKGTVRAGITLVAMATAINILASAMEKLSGLSWGDIIKGLTSTSVSILVLSSALKIIGKGGTTLRTSISIIALAQACKMIAEALQEFGKMSWDEISRGLTAMGGALLEFTAVLSVLSKVGGFGSLLGSLGILVAVQSLDEISENLKRLGDLKWDEIGRGLSAMGGALLEFTAVLSVLSKVGGFGSVLGAAAVLIASKSLDEISENLKRLGDLKWDEIGRGLSAMGGALLELSLAVGVLGKLTGFSGLIGAGSLLIGVQSLEKLAASLEKFGGMSWDEIGRGLSAMGGALAELAIISGLLGTLAGFSGLLGSGAILLGVQGLGDLADALQKFGGMSWDEIGRGLSAMGGALLELSAITGLTGTLAPLGALIGSGSLLLAVQGLGDLADAFKKFGEMSWDEINRGFVSMADALSATALGGIMNTFSGLGASSISKMAEPLGTLADSVKKWQGVVVPENLGTQLSYLASGVESFTFGGWGASAISEIANPIGIMADSIKKWQGVVIPEDLGTQLSSLAYGVESFTFGGWGADALSVAAPGIGQMADSVKKWQGVAIPEDLGTNLTSLANGVSAFSFAFVGGWSISAIVDPLSSLADTVSKWSGVTIPENIDTGLKSLADGIDAFNFSFVGGWSISSIVGPLDELSDSVKKWNNVELKGVGADLTSLANGLTDLANVGIKKVASQFEDAAEKITNSVTKILDKITTTVNSKKGEIVSSFDAIMSESVQKITSKQPEIETSAKEIMIKFSNVIKATSVTIVTDFDNIMKQLVNTVRSKHDDFKSAGSYVVQGLAEGIRSNANAAVLQAKAMANAVEKASRAELGVRSPSVVMKEIGHYVVQGLAEGITEDMSAEEAMAQKAQNIVTAFQSALGSLDISDSTVDLEYQLWEKTSGADATEGEKNLAQINMLTNKLNTQTERVRLAQAEYQATMDHFGAVSSNTQEAYNKLLQEQIDLATIAEEINTVQQTITDGNQEAFQKYNTYILENQKALLDLGYTIEEIKSAAERSSGYNPNSMQIGKSIDVQEIIDSALKNVEVAYSEGIESTMQNITAQSSNFGTKLASSIGTGIQNGTPQVTNNVSNMLDSCATKINSSNSSWEEGGNNLVLGFIKGIRDNVELAAQEAAAMALKAYQAAMAAIDARSPSRLFETVGSFVTIGFANGIKNGEVYVKDSATSMAESAINSTKDIISRLAEVMENSVDVQPTIRPVLDLSDVESKVGLLDTMFTRNQALSVANIRSQSGSYENQNGESDSSVNPTYQFVQNNYSPKSLSRVEIYRQTKNQFSAFERRLKRD